MPEIGTPNWLDEIPGPGWVRADLQVQTVDVLARVIPLKCWEQPPVSVEEVTAISIERLGMQAPDVAHAGIEGAAYVDGGRGHEHPRAGAEGKHGPTTVSTRREVAASKSASTSTMTAPTHRRTPEAAGCLARAVGTNSTSWSGRGALARRAKC